MMFERTFSRPTLGGNVVRMTIERQTGSIWCVLRRQGKVLGANCERFTPATDPGSNGLEPELISSLASRMRFV